MSVYKLGSISLCFETVCASFSACFSKRKSLVTYSFSLWPMLPFAGVVVVVFRISLRPKWIASNGKSFATKLALFFSISLYLALNEQQQAIEKKKKNERLLSPVLSFVHTQNVYLIPVCRSGSFRRTICDVTGTTSAGWAAHFGLNGHFFFFFFWWKTNLLFFLRRSFFLVVSIFRAVKP